MLTASHYSAPLTRPISRVKLRLHETLHHRYVQATSQWVTIRLLAIGLRVSIAPACVRSVADADCLPPTSRHTRTQRAGTRNTRRRTTAACAGVCGNSARHSHALAPDSISHGVSNLLRPYKSLGGNSGVEFYALHTDAILVIFRSGAAYLYTSQRPGLHHVQRMSALAEAGAGLSTYISRYVHAGYAEVLSAAQVDELRAQMKISKPIRAREASASTPPLPAADLSTPHPFAADRAAGMRDGM